MDDKNIEPTRPIGLFMLDNRRPHNDSCHNHHDDHDDHDDREESHRKITVRPKQLMPTVANNAQQALASLAAALAAALAFAVRQIADISRIALNRKGRIFLSKQTFFYKWRITTRISNIIHNTNTNTNTITNTYQFFLLHKIEIKIHLHTHTHTHTHNQEQ